MTRPSPLKRRSPTGRLFAVAALLGLPLAACQQSPMTTASVPLSVEDRHPIGVVPERVVLDLRPAAGAITSHDAAELRSFVIAYGQEGNGPLYVLAPRNGADRASAELVYAETRRIANDSGIPVAAISYADYQAVTGPAPVRLLYERLTAATTCGQWPTNAAAGAGNEQYYNYGCATRKNFAAMLEDPRDLEGPRPTTPRDASRRDVVFDKYRKGEPTATQSAEDSGGEVSEVGN